MKAGDRVIITAGREYDLHGRYGTVQSVNEWGNPVLVLDDGFGPYVEAAGAVRVVPPKEVVAVAVTPGGRALERLADGTVRDFTVECPACGGAGGERRVVYWDRSDPNACYPDDEECGACEGEGRVTEKRAEEIRDDMDREEAAMESSYEERERWAREDEREEW